jgi:hypothetical protein
VDEPHQDAVLYGKGSRHVPARAAPSPRGWPRAGEQGVSARRERKQKREEEEERISIYICH